MTRAADRLNISRSAASEHIRAVEARLRLVLFSRTNRNLELTHAGTLLMQQARTLLNQAAQFASFSRALHGELDGELVISANSDPVKSRIGEIFASLRERCPLISVDLRARHSTSVRVTSKVSARAIGAARTVKRKTRRCMGGLLVPDRIWARIRAREAGSCPVTRA